VGPINRRREWRGASVRTRWRGEPPIRWVSADARDDFGRKR
jgi:hypothetical protein